MSSQRFLGLVTLAITAFFVVVLVLYLQPTHHPRPTRKAPAHKVRLGGISLSSTPGDNGIPNYSDPNWGAFEANTGIYYSREGWAATDLATYFNGACGYGPRYATSAGIGGSYNYYMANWLWDTWYNAHLVPVIAIGMNTPAGPPSNEVEACAAMNISLAATEEKIPLKDIYIEPYNEPDTGTNGVSQPVSTEQDAQYVGDVEYGLNGLSPILIGSFGNPNQEYAHGVPGDCGGKWSYADCFSSWLRHDKFWTKEIVGWSVHDYSDPTGAVWDYSHGYGIRPINSGLSNFRDFDYHDSYGGKLPIWVTETGGPVVFWGQQHNPGNDYVGAWDVLYQLAPYTKVTMWYQFANDNPGWDSALVDINDRPRTSECVLRFLPASDCSEPSPDNATAIHRSKIPSNPNSPQFRECLEHSLKPRGVHHQTHSQLIRCHT